MESETAPLRAQLESALRRVPARVNEGGIELTRRYVAWVRVARKALDNNNTTATALSYHYSKYEGFSK